MKKINYKGEDGFFFTEEEYKSIIKRTQSIETLLKEIGDVSNGR